MSNLDDLPGQLVELRELIRQAHEANSDLRATLREAIAVRDSLPAAAEQAVTEKLGAEVQRGLAEFGEALDKAIDSGTQAVFRRFDKLEKLFLGEDDRTVRAGKPSIPELIETIAAADRNAPPALRRLRKLNP